MSIMEAILMLDNLVDESDPDVSTRAFRMIIMEQTT